MGHSLRPIPRVTNPNPPTGRVILLSGPSSAGKSSLARCIQHMLATPFMHFSSDHLAQALDARRSTAGPFSYWAEVRPRFFTGFHRSIAAFASAGNDLVVDHLIEFASWRDELRQLLTGFDLFLVGVHCSLEELERREHARGDRRLGEAREHVVDDQVHQLGAYDFEIDSTGRTPESLAEEVIAAWQRRKSPSAL